MPCWSFEPLIGFPLEPVCDSELFPPHSPISPLESDMGGSAGSAAAGEMRNASTKKAVTTRQTHLRGPREAKRRIIHPAERSVATPTNKVLEKLPTRPTSFGYVAIAFGSRKVAPQEDPLEQLFALEQGLATQVRAVEID